MSTDIDKRKEADTFKRARIGTGLSHGDFADLVGVADGRTVRRWEAGERDIPGPVWALLELIYEVPETQDYLDLKVDPNWRDIDLTDKP